jgi:hypothetical protein
MSPASTVDRLQPTPFRVSLYTFSLLASLARYCLLRVPPFSGDLVWATLDLVNPEILAHLFVQANRPRIADIVELHQVGGFSKPHRTVFDVIIPIGVEDGIEWHFGNFFVVVTVKIEDERHFSI